MSSQEVNTHKHDQRVSVDLSKTRSPRALRGGAPGKARGTLAGLSTQPWWEGGVGIWAKDPMSQERQASSLTVLGKQPWLL